MTKERGHSIMDERKADRMELSGVAGNAGGDGFSALLLADVVNHADSSDVVSILIPYCSRIHIDINQ